MMMEAAVVAVLRLIGHVVGISLLLRICDPLAQNQSRAWLISAIS